MAKQRTEGVGAALRALGINTEQFERIRLGAGVLGISGRVFLAAFVVLAVIAARAPPAALVVLGLMAVGLVVLFFIGGLIFAAFRPGEALLGGMDLLSYRSMTAGTRSSPEVLTTVVIENPALNDASADAE